MTNCLPVKSVHSLLHPVYDLYCFVGVHLRSDETGEVVIPDSRLCRLIPCDFFSLCLLKTFSLDEVLELLFCVAGGDEPVAEIEVESTRRKLGNLKS